MSTVQQHPLSVPGPPPPLDRACAAALALLPPWPELTPERIPESRALPAGLEVPTDEQLRRGGAFRIEERLVTGPQGEPDVALLICRPTTAMSGRPVLYHVHGGGMIAGDSRMALPAYLDWAEEHGLVVVSVAYRLAPETPYPGPLEDCYAGLRWTYEHASEIGGDPDRIIVIGESAGGGLTAALTMLARDRRGPAPFGQLLLAPMLDDRNDSPSARQMAGVDTWDRSRNEVGWAALLGGARGGPDVPYYAAPARAVDLSGLPPTFLDVGSAETFRDEVLTFAARIWQAGGRAELHVWPGGYHGYDVLAPEAAISQETRAARSRWLRRLLAG